MKKIFFLFSLLFLLGTGNLSAQLWNQVGSDIDGEAVGDGSGVSVSFNAAGNRVAIGAHQNDGNGTNAGHVRVYSESGGVWTQMGGDIEGEAPHDFFGVTARMSADGLRVVIGAINNDGNGSNAGHVRVYKLSGGAWIQVGPDIEGEAAGNLSGWSVATNFDGKRVAIGSSGNIGHVRVFKQSGNNWVQVGAILEGGAKVSMSLDGKVVAIGERTNDDNGTDAGRVRVFKEINGTWIQEGNDIEGEAAGDFFGHTVSLSGDGNILAIGASLNDGNGTDAGHARVFENIGGAWTQLGTDIDGEAEGDNSGSSISLSSNGLRVAIGAGNNDGNGTDAGHVRVFENSGGTWTLVGSDIEGEEAGDAVGGTSFNMGSVISLSSDGDRVAIGASNNDGNGIYAGHVRVYKQVPCDADGDSYDNVACGGSDCDDNNIAINPGVIETCNGVDDNCNNIVDESTADVDGDGVCDDLDNCPTTANTNQADADSDDIGDACDACPNDPNNDADGDGICGDVDNCPSTANSGQQDSDCDTVGDACDVCPDGDDSIDNNNDGIPDCNQLLNYALYSAAWKCGTNKIYVCHSDVTTCISKNQLSTHYNHGDDIGPCVSCGGQNFNIPDDIGGFAAMDEHPELEIFPNPATDQIQLHYAGEINELRLISAQGKIYSPETDQDLREINLDRLPSGLYVLMVRSVGSWVTKKFIKI